MTSPRNQLPGRADRAVVGELPQERRGDGVGRVEAPRGDPGAGPPLEHAREVLPHRRLVVVEGDQAAVPLEGAVAGLAARPGPAGLGPGQPEPRGVRRGRPVAEHLAEGPEVPAHVVEHPVQGDGHAAVRGRGHQVREVVGVAEAGVHPVVGDGVVAVAGAAKTGPRSRPSAPRATTWSSQRSRRGRRWTTGAPSGRASGSAPRKVSGCRCHQSRAGPGDGLLIPRPGRAPSAARRPPGPRGAGSPAGP